MNQPLNNVRCKQCGRRMVPRVHHGNSECPFCLSPHWDQERSGFEVKFFALNLIACSLLLAVALPPALPFALVGIALALWILRKANQLKSCSPREALKLLFRR